MISKPNLKKLTNRYLQDSKVLLDNKRYASSVYLAGYAVELALKYRISKFFRFGSGYPESPPEFKIYTRGKSRFTGTTIKSIADLKIHNLTGLLFYCGEEINILNNYATEWNIIKSWNVLLRYNSGIVRKVKAISFHNSAKKVIGELL